MTAPTLLAVAHGTRSAAGQAQIRDLVDRVALLSPGLDIRLSYVDVQQPRLADVVPAVRDAVVVPLLLSTGYHVRVDIADAVRGTGFPVAGPLGPDDSLRDAMTRHLPATATATATATADPNADPNADADAGADPGTGPVAVVLAAAGSSDPAWRASVAAEAAALGAHVAYASGSGPRVADVVAGLRAAGARRVAIAAYLLADGLFYRTLHRAGADSVTPPLCHDPAVPRLIMDRYLTTAAAAL